MNAQSRTPLIDMDAELTDTAPLEAALASSYILGVDIGRTFTDLLLVREDDGAIFTAKLPSTPAGPTIAVLDGIEKIAERHNIAVAGVHTIVHGTTVATSALLTLGGVKVGLLTTKGFRDVPHIDATA